MISKLLIHMARAKHTLSQKTIAIRRESINLWERRAPLAPEHIKQLTCQGVKVLVQPSNRRAFIASEYEAVGAEIREDLSEASLIMGVKKPEGLELHDLIPGKTYAFFTHTIKAQEENMALLDTLLERDIRIIDYERMLDSDGNRVVAFGQYAGISGMINILHGIGIRLLALGHSTPFLHVGLSHNYRSVEQARQAVRDAGYEIALGRMPRSIGPLTFVFTGSGNVSIGAQKIFDCLPFEYVKPSELKDVALNGDLKKVYATVVSRKDHYQRRDDGQFDAEEFDKHPERYISTFSKDISPWASCIINGIYYAPGAPRIITVSDMKRILKPREEKINEHVKEGCPALPHRLIALCDISADPGGSIEFMKSCTTIDKPFCLYDPETDTNDISFVGPGVLVCSIDNLPAQLPREATRYFGTHLLPFVEDMIASNSKTPFDEYNARPVVKNAVITSNKALTPNYTYINDLREKKGQQSSTAGLPLKKNVLVLGAGYVVPPLVEYLARDTDVSLTIMSNSSDDLDDIKKEFKDVNICPIDITNDPEALKEAVDKATLVVSLIPWKFHPIVAKACIEKKKNLVTASYCTPELKQMEREFESAGITAVMELGLDPGIDHLLAMECFDEVQDKGGRITDFLSFAGALPAPECLDNPLKYKFSWSPSGSLSTIMNPAKYIANGKIEEIPSGGELMNHAKEMNIFPGFNFEGYPNRDSTKYIDIYGLKNCSNVVRGTLRYKGFTGMMKTIIDLGFMSQQDNPLLEDDGSSISMKQLTSVVLGLPINTSETDLKAKIQNKLNGDSKVVQHVKDLGMLSDDEVKKMGNPFYTICEYWSKTLSYNVNQRDMIALSHQIGVQWPDKSREMRNIELVIYGDAGKGKSGLALGKTVGIPAAIGAKMVLDGVIKKKGIVLPMTKDIYSPMLKELSREGIKANETISRI